MLDVYGNEITQDQIDRDEFRTYDGEYYPANELEWSDVENQYIPQSQSAAIWPDDIATADYVEYGDYYYVSSGEASGYYVYCDECRFCEDIQEEVLADDAHSGRDGYYYFYEDNIPSDDECQIRGYHSTSEFLDLTDGSQFKIGIEIEKDNFNGSSQTGDAVPMHRAIAGYETDSSCGVEAITHILPLEDIDTSTKAQEVFEMLDEAELIINSEVNENCGGHMTFSVRGYSDGHVVLEGIKPYLSIVYAMFKERLNGRYCSNNKKGKRGENTKYSPLNVKGDRVEIRLYGAIRSVEQLKLRYRLMYEILNHGINKCTRFEQFLKDITPLLLEIYKGEENKVISVIQYARAFRHYLMDAFAHSSIKKYV